MSEQPERTVACKASVHVNPLTLNPPVQDLEAACRRIMGNAARSQAWLTTYEGPTPTQIMEAVDMLRESWPVSVVASALDVLQRWGWFKDAGLNTKAPWEVTSADWDALIAAAPWYKRDLPGQGFLL